MRRVLVLIVILITPALLLAQAPATRPAEGKLAHIQVDVKARNVRVDCQMLGVEVPLEFLCVLTGTNEHEAALRTPAMPSDIHLALLMLGLEPGQPVRYSEAAKKWLPPHGPPLRLTVEFAKDGNTVRIPATRLMRSIRTKEPMPQHAFIFAGSQLAPDGTYAADITGYVVSIVNFELSLLDVPQLASNSNETLEWEINRDEAPPAGTAVTLIIEPMNADHPATQPADKPRAEASPSDPALDRLRERWASAVAPHRDEMRRAAQAHYEVITELRREQQKLIDEADKIQRLIDELEQRYQEVTTPQPIPDAQGGR